MSLTGALSGALPPARLPLPPAPRTFRAGLAVSLCVHALALLGLSGWAVQTLHPTDSGLEVVLLNTPNNAHEPQTPQWLAQVASAGGGDAQPHAATAVLPYTGPDAPSWVQDELRQRQLQLEAAQREVLQRLRAEQAAAVARVPSLNWAHRAASGQDEAEQEALLRNAQLAALAEQVQAYERQPRTHFFAPSTSPSPYAAYVDAWRRKVEAVGTQHYPREARGRLYGSLRMTVLLAANGRVRAIEIDQPSEHALLNQAARRIVQLAAPFAPFPPEIAREAEQLSITRTWHFVNDRVQTSIASTIAPQDSAPTHSQSHRLAP